MTLGDVLRGADSFALNRSLFKIQRQNGSKRRLEKQTKGLKAVISNQRNKSHYTRKKKKEKKERKQGHYRPAYYIASLAPQPHRLMYDLTIQQCWFRVSPKNDTQATMCA